ncbi:hypothetical protein [uncultured Polaribacter sp.]|uniref:hypothetical protein n=1 Tax=uncultured Polaribacter sp. TaxID=174711 RepID=UPI00236C9B1C|nr:hypothetical protein [Polaribacter sp.]
MKKIFYSFAILSLLFTSCNPMEDIYSEIDATETVISGEATFTLTDADYDALDLNYGNFSSLDDAKADLPDFLSGKYPAWGAESLAAVTFKLYNKVNTYSKNIYALSDAEHNAITGKTYGNFDRSYHVTNYLEATYPDASEGDFYSLKYRFYAGGESTLTDGFVFENSEWTKITGFTPDNYNDMGESYPNFSSHDEAEIKIPVALIDVYKFAAKQAGDIVTAMYELYKGGGVTKSYTANYIFDGSSWSKYTNTINETIKFGHDGTTWVPDNTIKYTLTGADYTLVGNGNYGNFDVRAGKDEEQESVRLDKVNTILLNNFPSDAEGQKYIVSYNIYNGAAGVWSLAVIKEGGAYVMQ